MKSFKEYLIESQEEKKYVFKVKIAGQVPDHCEDVMETALQKYQVAKFAKGKTSPIQAKLQDFPSLENESVTVYDIELMYPTTSTVLTAYIAEQTGVSVDRIRVRSLQEEAESELNAENCGCNGKEADPLLVQEYTKENNQALVGEKGVSNFLKDLAKVRKDQQPEQYKGVNDALLAKKAPVEKAAKVEKTPTAKSPLGAVSNPDPRKGK